MTRDLIKKTVMTIPYNISLTGIGEQFMELFVWTIEGNKKFIRIDSKFSKTNNNLFISPKEFGVLTKIVYITLTKKLPSLNLLSEYLNEY